MLSEISHTQKDKYSMTSLICEYCFTSEYTQTSLMKWRCIACICKPTRDHRHKPRESSVGNKKEKQFSQDSSITALLFFATVRFIPTVTHPQHHLQAASKWPCWPVTCKIIPENSGNSKARRPPEGALSLPSSSLDCFQQTQQVPKRGFDQWRPGWYW